VAGGMNFDFQFYEEGMCRFFSRCPQSYLKKRFFGKLYKLVEKSVFLCAASGEPEQN
jgi:predicted N-acyltransferase